jgi:hypothetical protein
MGSVGFIQFKNTFILCLLGILGMTAVGICTIFTFYYHFDKKYFSTVAYTSEQIDDYRLYNVSRYLTLSLGCLLILLQLFHLVTTKRTVLRRIIESSYFAQNFVHQAAVFKVARMIQNALNLHRSWKNEKEMGGTHTCFGRALLQFFRQSRDSDKFSLFRAWCHVFNGKLFMEEGIWLSSRLLSGVLIQILAICAACMMVPLRVQWLLEFNNPAQNCTYYDQTNCSFISLDDCYYNCTSDRGMILLEKTFCRLDCNSSCGDPCSRILFPSWA